jgi:hypothetical protein
MSDKPVLKVVPIDPDLVQTHDEKLMNILTTVAQIVTSGDHQIDHLIVLAMKDDELAIWHPDNITDYEIVGMFTDASRQVLESTDREE